MSPPIYHCHNWDEKHCSWLIAAARWNTTLAEIARKVGRTPLAVEMQMAKMCGISVVNNNVYAADLIRRFNHMYQYCDLETSSQLSLPECECETSKPILKTTNRYRLVMDNNTVRMADTPKEADKLALELITNNPNKEITIFEAVKKVFIPTNRPVIQKIKVK